MFHMLLPAHNKFALTVRNTKENDLEVFQGQVSSALGRSHHIKMRAHNSVDIAVWTNVFLLFFLFS